MTADTRVARELAALQSAEEAVLNLNYCNLRELPDSLVHSEHCRRCLRRLYLKRNLITTVPSEVRHLQALTELYLHSNNFQVLPSELALLPCLETLNVACNDIVSLSPSVGDMRALKYLNISRNCITDIPNELWRAPSLRRLIASANELRSISPEIIHCQTLQKLLLDRNKLSHLPPQISRLSQLVELSLCGNTLKTLPNDLSGLQSLERLYVDDNKELSCLPISLFQPAVRAVGTKGCAVVHFEEGRGELPRGVMEVGRCDSAIPPLLELTARAVHRYLKGSLGDSPLLWLPHDLCPLLRLPASLEQWLVPRGRCYRCGSEYFTHCSIYVISSDYCSAFECRANLSDVVISVDLCSLYCADIFIVFLIG